MKRHIITLAAAALLAGIGGTYQAPHQQTGTATATVHSATKTVARLYRDRTHSLPATDLSAEKIAHAKKALKQVPQAQLTATQRNQVTRAHRELAAATQMLTVTAATQTPVAATQTYQLTAEKGLSAYHRLQRVKPVFTQVYQQPVTDLHKAQAAAEAVTTLQATKDVTPAKITTTEKAVANVASPTTTAFPATAASVVAAAKQKLTAAASHAGAKTVTGATIADATVPHHAIAQQASRPARSAQP